MKSCTTLAAMCEGHEIRTVESLEVDGQLDPIQQGFHERHALQCGFCTPGMLMTARALLDENPNPTEHEIRTAISGAICRCTGYKNIVERRALGGRARSRRETGGLSMAIDVENLPSPDDRAADRLRPPEAQGGRALHPRQGHLPRRHPAARDGARGDPAQPATRTRRSSRSTPRGRSPTRTSPRSSPRRTSRRSASPGCRRSPTTPRPCSPATRSASRARRSRS